MNAISADRKKDTNSGFKATLTLYSNQLESVHSVHHFFYAVGIFLCSAPHFGHYCIAMV